MVPVTTRGCFSWRCLGSIRKAQWLHWLVDCVPPMMCTLRQKLHARSVLLFAVHKTEQHCSPKKLEIGNTNS